MAFVIVVLLMIITPISAHSGRTDANGGRCCRTNCAKWGLRDGEYHYHNDGGSSSSSSRKVIKVLMSKKKKKSIL